MLLQVHQAADGQYSEDRQQRQYEEQRRLAEASQYVQQQQRMDEQRLRQEFGGQDQQHFTEYEFDDLRGRVMRSTSPSWRRLYYVSPPTEVVKNRITRSQEVLNEDRYQIDIWQLKDRFMEKPEEQHGVERTGRVWQPPPEKPYEFPKPRPPYRRFVEYIEDKEHSWYPLVFDAENKNFTPHSLAPNEFHGQAYSNGYQQGPQQQQQQPAYTDDGRPPPPPQQVHQVVVRRESAPQQGMIETSPGYSSMVFNDQASSVPQSALGTPYPAYPPPSGSSSGGVARLENEPTPRHPSTMTIVDRPRVNIRDKIMSFENEGGGKMVVDPRAPRREFGIYHTRPYAVRSTSIDDDLMSSPHSSVDRRSVHFANSATDNRQQPNAVPATHRKVGSLH